MLLGRKSDGKRPHLIRPRMTSKIAITSRGMAFRGRLVGQAVDMSGGDQTPLYVCFVTKTFEVMLAASSRSLRSGLDNRKAGITTAPVAQPLLRNPIHPISEFMHVACRSIQIRAHYFGRVLKVRMAVVLTIGCLTTASYQSVFEMGLAGNQYWTRRDHRGETVENQSPWSRSGRNSIKRSTRCPRPRNH